MTKRLLADFDLCTGCTLCQLACSVEKSGNAFNPRHALLRVEMGDEGLVHRPVVCAQCRNPFCQRVCPEGAIERNDDGVLLIDATKCTGCGLCAEYCQLKVIVMGDATANKCDLCGGRAECVRACPTGALQVAG